MRSRIALCGLFVLLGLSLGGRATTPTQAPSEPQHACVDEAVHEWRMVIRGRNEGDRCRSGPPPYDLETPGG